MSEMTEIIVDTTRRIFEDLGDPQTIINAKDDSWRAPLWTALDDGGLTRAWADEAAGGAGDPPGQVEIEQKVLPQLLARRQLMGGDHRA